MHIRYMYIRVNKKNWTEKEYWRKKSDDARGCTLSPASRTVSPWLMTWSTKVAVISFESCCLLWPWPPLPALPLTLPPLLILTLPLPLPLSATPFIVGKKSAHLWSFSAYLLIEVATITVTIVWPGGTYSGPLSHVVSFWKAVVWNGNHVTLCDIVVSYAKNRVQCV